MIVSAITGWLASNWLLVFAAAVIVAAVANPALIWNLKAWILCAGIAWWGWTGHAAYDALVLANTKAENEQLRQVVAERDKAIAERNAAQRKADELAKPQREVAKSAKDNPSGCSLAKPTGDRLREQVRATNDAIRAVP